MFSGEVLLKLVEAGMRREDAYRIVQACAMTAVREGGSFRALLEADPEVAKRLDRKTLDRAFDLDKQLVHVDFLIRRALATGKRRMPAKRGSRTARGRKEKPR